MPIVAAIFLRVRMIAPPFSGGITRNSVC
jgi:hypothetical protein